MDNQVGLSDAVAELHDFDVTIGFAADAFVVVFAEDEGLSMLELDDVLAAGLAISQRKPRTVIKNVAVLQNLDEGGALVRGGVLQRFLQVSLKNVDRAGDKRSFRADRQRHWIEWALSLIHI